MTETDQQAPETNRGRVRRLLLDPLGFRHPKRVGEEEGRRALDAIADELAYLTDDGLEALARMLAVHGLGSSRDFWPTRASFVNFAHLIQPRPLEDDPKLLSWFSSIEGPRMIEAGTLVETWEFFARNRRPPIDPREAAMIADKARRNVARLELIDDRVRRGVGVDPEERDFALRYRARRAYLEELVKAERERKGAAA